MRRAALVAGGLMIVAAGAGLCGRWRRSAHAPRRAYVADEVLVRIPARAVRPSGAEGTLLVELQRLFGPPRDTCCPSDPQLTYRFGIGHRSVDQAIEEARALDPARVWAQPNFLYAQDKTPHDPGFKDQWSLDNSEDTDINALEAWDEITGDSRVHIAIVDSGVAYTNLDLVSRVWRNEVECPGSATGSPGIDDDGNGYIDDCHGIDATTAVNAGNSGPVPAGDPKPGTNDPNVVPNDHGTAVAGIAAAAGDNGTLMAGVTWDARIILCKFFEGPLDGTTFDLERCLRYVFHLKHSKALDLVAVNLSWGTSRYDDLVYCAIDDLRHEGILAVAAAGNDGTDNDEIPHYPASYFLPNVIAVAEVDNEDHLVGDSNRGARSVDTAAPGEVLSLGLGDKLKAFGATSAAAPHVTGLLALLEAKNLKANNNDLACPGLQNLDWRGLKNLVLAGGKPLGDLERKVISRRRIRAWDPEPTSAGGTPNCTEPRMGSLTCRHQVVQRQLRPLENHTENGKKQLLVAPGTSLFLAAISIECAAPAGPVEVLAVDSGGSTTISIPLHDDDLGHGQGDGDGIFTADWTPPPNMTDFVLRYRYGTAGTEITDDAITVRVVASAPPGEPQQMLDCTPRADGPQA